VDPLSMRVVPFLFSIVYMYQQIFPRNALPSTSELKDAQHVS
jgi:hypothetical protein